MMLKVGHLLPLNNSKSEMLFFGWPEGANNLSESLSPVTNSVGTVGGLLVHF